MSETPFADMMRDSLERNLKAFEKETEDLKIAMCFRRAGKTSGTWESFRLRHPELNLPTWEEIVGDDHSNS